MAPATSTSTSSHHININSNIFLDMDIGADGYGHTWLTRNIMEQAFARNIQGIELCKEHHEKINVSS
jgi:UDP-N-acetyl-D-mannosaminuronic acid transferase (WecB/TagA/CpsF family)